MKHFTTAEWIDFVNQVTSQKQQAAMQKHLGTGCKGCEEAVALWQKIRNTAVLEASYQPPAADVRIAKAAFAAAGRATHLGTRQMLYRADPYQIDIQIEAKPEGNRLMVTGQLLDVSSPGIVGRNVNITLSNHRGNVIHTVTNQFGEFRGEIENSGDLELSFPGKGEKSIVISLRNALGNLHGSKA